ncbi:MAG: hypothetical protein KDB61_04105 [Planctomycetes bacterium]|nr:hypothetical protein [Planctomycetota bacterium]
MAPQSSKVGKQPAAPTPGHDLRSQAESLGSELQDRLSNLIAQMPRRILGPQALVDTLDGINIVTASRLLKGLGQKDSIATLQLLPGPKPLQKIVDVALEIGVDPEIAGAATEAIQHFDRFIREQSGDRSSLKAMLSAWLPEERREFENQRRQTIFKARHELEGVSSELELDGVLLHPSAQEGSIDIVAIKALFGIDRIRPDAIVKLGTRRMLSSEDEKAAAEGKGKDRLPTTLDGDLAYDGLHSIFLEDFCASPPAPLVAERIGMSMHYSLGPTGFGPMSRVDLVVAEVNRAEMKNHGPAESHKPHFWVIPEMPSRKLVFDVLVHEDVYVGRVPHLYFYDTTGQGPAAAGDPARRLDQRKFTHSIEAIGKDLRRLRLLEFPAYGQLKAKIFKKLGWDSSKFRAYRVAITYPLTGIQVSLSFHPAE